MKKKTVKQAKPCEVDLSEKLKRQIKKGKIPINIQNQLIAWSDDVEDRGIDLTRKIPGYHDEPLQGSERRSIRLNRQWRAEYTEGDLGVIIIITVERVHPHDY